MTARGCVFGNSHLAALRTAWTQRAEPHPDISLDFVGAHRNGLIEVEIEDGILRPITETARQNMARINRREEFPLTGYDFLAVCGSQMSVSHVMKIYRRFRFAGLPSFDVTADIEDLEHELISAPAASAALADMLHRSVGFRFAALAGKAAGLPVYLIEQPRPSDGCLADKSGRYAGFKRALRLGDAAVLDRMYRDAFGQAASPLGHPLFQPDATIRDAMFTAEAYSIGSVRLARKADVAHPEDDFIHANAAYGALVLEQLAGAVLQDAYPAPAGSGVSARL